MPSSERLDLPENWSDTPLMGFRLCAAGVVMVAIAVIAIFAGYASATAGNVTAVKYCLVFALAAVLISAFPASVRIRRALSTAVRTVERDGVPMTEIRYSAVPFTLLVTLMTCFTTLFLMGGVEIAVNNDEGFPAGAIPMTAIALFLGSFLAAVVSGRIRRGRVSLSREGIFHRGWSFESRLDWSAIAGGQSAFHTYPMFLVFGYADARWDRRDTTRFWHIDQLPPVPMVEFDLRQFGVHPRDVCSFIQVYVDYPVLRHELGTEAALHRARQLDAKSDSAP